MHFTICLKNDIIIIEYIKVQIEVYMQQFNGFPKEFVDFLIQLSFNNTIEKQSENLISYKKYITQPLNQLYNELLPVVCEINSSLEIKPVRCISTPYTDRRFSPSTPLKEYMYLRFKQGGKSKDIVGLYFDMGADMYSYGFRIYKQTSGGFQNFKDDIIENPKIYENEFKTILNSGYKIIGEKYKKDHYPQIKSEVLNDFLNRKSFYICRDFKLNGKVFTPELANEIADGFNLLGKFVNLIIV